MMLMGELVQKDKAQVCKSGGKRWSIKMRGDESRKRK